MDTRLADHRGDEIRGIHVGFGWHLQPIISGRRFGLACLTRQPTVGAVQRLAPSVLPGLSDESDEREFVVPLPTGQGPRVDDDFLAFADNLRRLRDKGLVVTAPSTPPEAFRGRPPPPLSRDQAEVGRDTARVVYGDFEGTFPTFANIIAIAHAEGGRAHRLGPVLLFFL